VCAGPRLPGTGGPKNPRFSLDCKLDIVPRYHSPSMSLSELRQIPLHTLTDLPKGGHKHKARSTLSARGHNPRAERSVARARRASRSPPCSRASHALACPRRASRAPASASRAWPLHLLPLHLPSPRLARLSIQRRRKLTCRWCASRTRRASRAPASACPCICPHSAARAPASVSRPA
jgi:hypothetical protein